MKSLILATLLLCFTLPNEALSFARNNKQELISQGVYGTHDALDKSRIDIADRLAADTAKLVTPPKNPLKIEKIDGKVILPANMTGEIVRVSSAEYRALLNDRKVKAQLEKSLASQTTFAAKVNSQLIQTEADLKREREKSAAKIQSLESKVKSLSFYRNLVWGIVGSAALVGILLFLIKTGLLAIKLW